MERLKLTTKIEASISEWSKSKMKINGSGANIDSLNKKLSNIINRPNNFLDECHRKEIAITKDMLKMELLKIIAPEKFSKIVNDGKIIDLLTYTNDYIERNPKNVKESTLKTAGQLIPKLERFATLYGNGMLLFDNITTLWETMFVNFLYKEYELNIGTKDKWIRIVMSLMKQARKEKKHNNREYEDFECEKKDDMKTDAIDLSEDEIEQMYNLKLSPKLDPTRDLWVFSAETGGIRISDILRWDKNNWLKEEGAVRYTPIKTVKKTFKELYVPLTKIGTEILVKYNGELPKMDENTYNDNLKDIGKLIPSLHELFKVKTTKGGKIKFEMIERYKLLGSHTARRSFCMKELRAGTPKEIIMALSGHRSESSFNIYDRRKQEENANRIKEYYKSRGKSV
jgi:integrase